MVAVKTRQGRGSGFGKVILLGEHAVVYGVPALAAALSQRVRAIAVPGPARRAHLSVPDWGLDATAGGSRPADRALSAILSHLGLEDLGFEVVVEPEIPAGAGLGASAAMAVAVARAVADLAGRPLDDAGASEAALAAEQVFHGNPSGLDNAVAAHGGTRYYRRGEPLEPVRVAAPLPLIVGHSGKPGATRETVAAVAALRRGRAAETESRFASIAKLVAAARAAIESGDTETLGECMTENHAHLQWLGVSTPDLDRLVDLALEAGAAGAKLTGGGGGGCAIALAPGAEEAVEAAWRAAGYTAFRTAVRGAGLPVL